MTVRHILTSYFSDEAIAQSPEAVITSKSKRAFIPPPKKVPTETSNKPSIKEDPVAKESDKMEIDPPPPQVDPPQPCVAPPQSKSDPPKTASIKKKKRLPPPVDEESEKSSEVHIYACTLFVLYGTVKCLTYESTAVLMPR